MRGYGNEGEALELHLVTHWMPMPDPPEAVGPEPARGEGRLNGKRLIDTSRDEMSATSTRRQDDLMTFMFERAQIDAWPRIDRPDNDAGT